MTALGCVGWRLLLLLLVRLIPADVMFCSSCYCCCCLFATPVLLAVIAIHWITNRVFFFYFKIVTFKCVTVYLCFSYGSIVRYLLIVFLMCLYCFTIKGHRHDVLFGRTDSWASELTYRQIHFLLGFRPLNFENVGLCKIPVRVKKKSC